MSPLVSVLAGLAGRVGARLVERVLGDKYGPAGGRLVESVIDAISDRAGVAHAEELRDLPEPKLKEAIEQVELSMPELMELWSQGLTYQEQVFAAEQKEAWWAWAWRPAAMWGFGFLWLWGLVAVPVTNAFAPARIEPFDLWLLFQLNGVYMALYMGGHTIKDAFSKWTSGRGER